MTSLWICRFQRQIKLGKCSTKDIMRGGFRSTTKEIIFKSLFHHYIVNSLALLRCFCIGSIKQQKLHFLVSLFLSLALCKVILRKERRSNLIGVFMEEGVLKRFVNIPLTFRRKLSSPLRLYCSQNIPASCLNGDLMARFQEFENCRVASCTLPFCICRGNQIMSNSLI